MRVEAPVAATVLEAGGRRRPSGYFDRSEGHRPNGRGYQNDGTYVYSSLVECLSGRNGFPEARRTVFHGFRCISVLLLSPWTPQVVPEVGQKPELSLGVS